MRKSRRHDDVYGLWRQYGRVVRVRKSRGPCTGQLDLPGGAPEPGESPDRTLVRELREGCGVDVAGCGARQVFELHVTSDSRGRSIDFLHRGLVAAVIVTADVTSVVDVQDVAGVELIDLDALAGEELTPLRRPLQRR